VNARRGGNELVAARSQIVDKSRKQHRKLSLASTLAPPSCTTLIRNCGKKTRIIPDVRNGRISRSCIKLFSLTSRDFGISPFIYLFIFCCHSYGNLCIQSKPFAQQATPWTGQGSNECLRGKITTNRLSHGTAPNYEDLFTVTKCYNYRLPVHVETAYKASNRKYQRSRLQIQTLSLFLEGARMSFLTVVWAL